MLRTFSTQISIFALILFDPGDHIVSVRCVVSPLFIFQALNATIVFQSAQAKIGVLPVVAILADLT